MSQKVTFLFILFLMVLTQCTRTPNPDYTGFMGSLRQSRDWVADKLGLFQDDNTITPDSYEQKESRKIKEVASEKDVGADETGKKIAEQLKALTQSMKVEETKEETNLLAEKNTPKDPSGDAHKTSLTPSDSQKRDLTGKLKYILYAKKDFFELTIKAESSQSVALVTPKYLWRKKRQYFLRSKLKLQENAVFLTYHKKRIGPERKLFFLSSSTPISHSLLGQAFQIRIPKVVWYGYQAHHTEGKLRIIPGKTQLIIRKFQEKEGQGKFQDQEILLPTLQNIMIIQ